MSDHMSMASNFTNPLSQGCIRQFFFDLATLESLDLFDRLYYYIIYIYILGSERLFVLCCHSGNVLSIFIL